MIHETINLQVEGSESYARMETYLISKSEEIALPPRPIVIIAPGGGYCFTSEREAEMFALNWNARGYHALVVWYSVSPATYPTALLELATAVKTVKEKADQWDINPDQVFIQGSSAGGHLAASYGMFWSRDFVADYLNTTKDQLKVAGMILNYPVISSGPYTHSESIHNLLGDRYDELKEDMSLENQVSADTPPAFIWTTNEDGLVPAENSIYLALAMRKMGRPVELHMYMKGNHGLGLATELTMDRDGGAIELSCSSWFELAHTWTKEVLK